VPGDSSLARAMFGTMQSRHDQRHVDDPGVIARTVFVDIFGVNPADVGTDRATQERLNQSGRTAAQAFLPACRGRNGDLVPGGGSPPVPDADR